MGEGVTSLAFAKNKKTYNMVPPNDDIVSFYVDEL